MNMMAEGHEQQLKMLNSVKAALIPTNGNYGRREELFSLLKKLPTRNIPQ